MLYRELPASPKLQSVLACYWEFAANEGIAPGHMHSIPVDACVSIGYVRPGNQPTRVVLIGPRIQQVQVPAHAGDRIWGVRFLPGASRAAIGKSGSEWRDKVGLLDFELPLLAQQMRDALASVSSLEESAPIFDALIDPADTCPIAMAGVSAITKSRGTVRIADLPALAGLSERQFLRRFRDEVGLTPKQFARVCRFRATAIAALHSGGANWGEIAADQGFADQAHLNHEFQSLFGISPREFESRFLPQIEHVSLQSD